MTDEKILDLRIRRAEILLRQGLEAFEWRPSLGAENDYERKLERSNWFNDVRRFLLMEKKP